MDKPKATGIEDSSTAQDRRDGEGDGHNPTDEESGKTSFISFWLLFS